ncbi:MAG: hypothetical protein AAGJ69_03605 [Cyanobacteria bacterium J06559_1]
MDNTHYQLLLIHKKWRLLLIVGSLFWVILMLLLYVQSFVPVGDITRDPATIAEHPPYYGALSNLGILLWSASAAVCFLSATLLKVIYSRASVSAFFAIFAGLSAILCLDDTYQLHEDIFINSLPGFIIPEQVTISVYAAVVLFAISRFQTVLQETPLWLFSLSLLLFLVAAGTDYVIPHGLVAAKVTFLIEDGTKLLGIFFWLTYFFRTSIDLIVAAADSQLSWFTAAQATTFGPSPSVMKVK